MLLIITGIAGKQKVNLGYDNKKMLFQGYADGVDGKLDDSLWGSPDFKNDYIRMNWNKDWERGISENWENPPYDGATLTSVWNGKTPDGSGQVWDYKMNWVGSCGSEGAIREDGSFCIWGQFAIYMSNNTSVSGRFWDAHAVPPGIITER